MIYIYSPATSVSGGPELLHQLCRTLNDLEIPAQMVYFWSWLKINPKIYVAERYKVYETQNTKKVVDTHDNIVVVPETAIYLLNRYKRVKKIIWWLSVDLYFESLKSKKHRINTLMGLLDRPVKNIKALSLCQSLYAKSYVQEHFGLEEQNVYMLSDYLNDAFIKSANDEMKREKKDIVLYNPKKGFDVVKGLIESAPDIEWRPVINMTPFEISELMQTSKLYIDFGNHPGKDRLPREAAISGCCVLTGRKGAAANPVDVQIPQKYKIDENRFNKEDVILLIRSILKNYTFCRGEFDSYREKIRREEIIFKEEVYNIFGKCV